MDFIKFIIEKLFKNDELYSDKRDKGGDLKRGRIIWNLWFGIPPIV